MRGRCLKFSYHTVSYVMKFDVQLCRVVEFVIISFLMVNHGTKGDRTIQGSMNQILYNINVKIYIVCQCLTYKIQRKKQSDKKQHSEIEVIEISRTVFSLLLFFWKWTKLSITHWGEAPEWPGNLEIRPWLVVEFRKKQEGESPSPWCMFLKQVVFFFKRNCFREFRKFEGEISCCRFGNELSVFEEL